MKRSRTQLFLMVLCGLCLTLGSCLSLRSLPKAPVMHGPVAVAPTSGSGGTSSTINDLIAQHTAASAAGNKTLANALKSAIFDTSAQENVSDTNSSMRFFMGISVIVIGLGVGLMVWGAPKLGLTVAGTGAGMIGAALLIEAIIPFLLYIAVGALILALIAGLWLLHIHFAALKAVVMNNGVSTDPHVKALISKVRASVPSKQALETDVKAGLNI